MPLDVDLNDLKENEWRGFAERQKKKNRKIQLDDGFILQECIGLEQEFPIVKLDFSNYLN